METAIAEVEYHQGQYFGNVEDLKFDRLVFRGLSCVFTGDVIHDATGLPTTHAIYHSTDYKASRALGAELRTGGSEGVQYWSVRNAGAMCWGLFTPKQVQSVVQTAHYEFILSNGKIVDKRRIVVV